MYGLQRFWEQRLYPVRNSLVIVLVFISGFVLGSQRTLLMAQGTISAPAGTETEFEPFWQVFNLIQNSYLDRDSISTEQLVDGAIGGMVDSLGDQFSGYMDAETFPLLNNDLSGEVEGIGAEVIADVDTDEIRIVNVLDGSPAKAAGLQAGDVFVRVNGEDVSKLSQLELVGKVRGPEGSTVTLTMRRDEALIEFTIIRAKIMVATVEYQKLENEIGYIKLRDFNEQALDQVKQAIGALGGESLSGLILDLRGNPGGLLSTAIDISSLFLEEGTVLVEDFGNEREQTYTANGEYIGYYVPLTILVDENSASASELVAGALQDQGLATIIGAQTFGKGTVQTWQPLVNGGGVRLTIARWLTPNGNWIHENGITPDVIVEQADEADEGGNDLQLRAAIDYLKSQASESVPAG